MADPICRWRNATVKQVCEFNQLLPKHTISKEQGRSLIEQRSMMWDGSNMFFRTAYQLAVQMAMYFEDESNMYVRFHKVLSLEEAEAYINYWAKNYYVPNPYSASLKLVNVADGIPVVLNRFLVNWLIDNGETSWDEVKKALFPDASIGNDDILQNLINNFFEVKIEDGVLKGRDGYQLNKYDSVHVDIDPDDRAAFFNHFKPELYSVSKSMLASSLPLQKIWFGTPGSGKSFYVNHFVKGNENHSYRTTFHPDTDYASFVGTYKPYIKKARKPIRTDYTLAELAAMLKSEYDQTTTKVVTFHSFVLKYVDYFNGNIAKYSKKDFVKQAGLDENYNVEVNKMVNLYDWMISSGYLKKDGSLTYEFVPQVFTNAYVEAWRNPEKDIYLVIEEINRGNCAQIFGDLFQLLDRDESGRSEFPVKADRDLREYLEREDVLGLEHEGIADGNLCLPGNLHIYATMNTSDQSLFPMDAAFKRRWDWEYVPIDAACPKSQFVITIGDKSYVWPEFLTEVNDRIHKLSDSEDKQMGNFFIKSDIDVEKFKGKVMFYLWNEVCKEYENAGSFFKYKADESTETEFTFNSLFPTNEATNKILQGFMAYLGVKPIEEGQEKSDGQA